MVTFEQVGCTNVTDRERELEFTFAKNIQWNNLSRLNTTSAIFRQYGDDSRDACINESVHYLFYVKRNGNGAEYCACTIQFTTHSSRRLHIGQEHKMSARQLTLRELTLRELHLATPTTPDTLGWCRQNGLLPVAMECDTCAPVNGARAVMEERPYTRSVDGVIWRCRRQNCRLMTFIQVH